MARFESAPVTVSPRGSMPPDGKTGFTVVWVRGDHDFATRIPLAVSIARAAQRDDEDLLIDLSEVTFMDASTVGALVASRERLAARSQSLLVRAPSPPARRVLELCGLAHIIHPDAPAHPTPAAPALGTWVAVAPSSPSSHDGPRPSEKRTLAHPRSTTGAEAAEQSATLGVDRSGP